MKRILIPIIGIAVLLTLVGCNNEKSTDSTQVGDSKREYYSDEPMSPIDYKMYVSKTISSSTQQINTHMSKLLDVTKGKLDVDLEIENLNSSIKTLKENKTNINYTMPPDQYKDTRTHLLNYLQKAIDKLEETKTSFNDGMSAEKATDLSSQLKDIYTSIQSCAI